MKKKTVAKVISQKIASWKASIDDPAIQAIVQKSTIVTGGCIASMLLKEPVNDFDIYLRSKTAAEALAGYYVKKFNERTGNSLKVSVEEDRVRIVVESGHRGATAGDVQTLTNPGEIEDTYEAMQECALEETPERAASYVPTFLSTNAITLSGKVQIVLRFFGDPEVIHQNYDFIHCTNYWKSWDDELVLNQSALESLLSRELIYVGSKYPVCSVFRLRKFIKRNWTINAGQILKMCYQISELDLTDIRVLEDQLTGVDVSYFAMLIDQLKERHTEKVNAGYLVEIINRMF